MINFNAVAADYLAAFNAIDPVERKERVSALFTADARYVDPMADVTGHDQLSGLIEGIQGQFPDWVFTPVGDVDGHHAQARFGWGLGPEGAEPPVVGFDVVVLDTDGRISAVHGFLDRVPSA